MRRGYTFIELIVYVSILATIILMFLNLLLAISKSHGQLGAIKDLNSSAMISQEVIAREIRRSSDVDISQSVFGSTQGVLVLNHIEADGNITTTKFGVSNSAIHVWSNGTDQGSLLPTGVTVTRLIFYTIDTGVSRAVKIEMQLNKKVGLGERTSNYYSTITLRGSYR